VPDGFLAVGRDHSLVQLNPTRNYHRENDPDGKITNLLMFFL
jgi:hypothetical protein